MGSQLTQARQQPGAPQALACRHMHQPTRARPSRAPCCPPSLASRIQDPGAWRGLEPHFGSNAARGALEQAAAAVSNLQLPSGGGGAQLPSLPSLPQLPQLPAGPDLSKFEIGLPSKLPAAPSLSNVQLPSVQLPSLPAVQLPEALPDASALANAARGGAAAAADAVAHLPEALAAEVALLQQLLASAPAALSQAASRGAAAAGGAAGMGAGAGAGGLGGLEPHFGTRAAQALLSEFGAALGARGVVPPMMQLPTGAAALADGSLPLPGGGDPSALAAALAGAWSAAGGAAAALLPPQAAAALAAGAAAAAAQPAAAAAAAAERLGALSAAAEQLRAAAVALPEAGHAGVDFPTLCFAAAGALLATAASVPPASYEASASAPSTTGGNNSASGAGFDPRDPPLSHEYDPEAVAAYFRRRPVAVASRAAALAAEAAALGAALAGDFATGRVAANEKARSAQLRGAIERLGPAYVKVAQVGQLDYSRAGGVEGGWGQHAQSTPPLAGSRSSQAAAAASRKPGPTAPATPPPPHILSQALPNTATRPEPPPHPCPNRRCRRAWTCCPRPILSRSSCCRTGCRHSPATRPRR